MPCAARGGAFVNSMKRYLPFIIIALVLVGAVVLASMLWRRGNPAGDSSSTFATTTNQLAPVVANSSAPTDSAPVAMPTKPNFKVSSPVVLEEYGDRKSTRLNSSHT